MQGNPASCFFGFINRHVLISLSRISAYLKHAEDILGRLIFFKEYYE
jgi:hypothetical protein